MKLNLKRFVAFEKYLLIAAMLLYGVCLFVLKRMPYALPFVFTACFVNLFQQRFFSARPKLAAINHLLPACVLVGSRFAMMERAAGTEAELWAAVILAFSLIPFALLMFSKTGETPSKRATIPMVKVRIAVQVSVFTLYALLSAMTWITGGKSELLFWAVVNILTVAVFPFLFGRALCGWLCPNATMQDGLYKNLPFKRPIMRLPDTITAQSRT